MGGKKGGGQRTPYFAPNTLESKQKIKLIHLLCAGEINGWQNGELLKSVRFNDTYVQNKDGSFNFNNVKVSYLAGALDQDYLAGFDAIERSISVGAQVKKATPITRTITNSLIGSLRVTMGVSSLFSQTNDGDMYGTAVNASLQIIKNNAVYTSKIWTLNEKGNTAFKQDVVFNDLPDAPFDLKVTRLTDDSTSDKLHNDTFFHSYVESVPQKFSYPTCAVVGVELDAEQMGGQTPTINYEVLGREIRVPSNYDEVKRTYTGMWDGSFKYAYTNNIAWIVYDVMTDELHGLGLYFKDNIIDKMKLYEIGQYADQMISDGEGGLEPRYVFNGLIQGGDATTILNNLCSVFWGRAIEKNGFISFIYDRGNAKPVATYTNANVINGLFDYSHASLDSRINSVHFEYADERDGCKLKVEEVSDQKSIARLNRINTQKITCYGQTKRSYALRHAVKFLETSATETESVVFNVGFQGVKHGAFDIIAVADNVKAGISIGGRIIEVAGKVVTLDRNVEGALEIRVRDTLYKVVRQVDTNRYELDKAVLEPVHSVFSANTSKATERLFKVISTEENKDGSYSVSAVKYDANKVSNVENGISSYPEITTTYNTIPVIVAGTPSNQGEYILLTWDTLASSGAGMAFTIQLFKDNKHYQTHTTTESELKLYNLPMGEYYAKIKGRSNIGVYSQEVIIAFSTTYTINNLVSKGVVLGVNLAWQNPPLVNRKASIEVWVSDTNTADSFSKIATLAYPQANHAIDGLSVGDELYVKVRLVDELFNYGEFTGVVTAKPSDNADDILSYLDGKISEKEISKDLQDQFDKNIDDKVNEGLGGVITDIESINGDMSNVKADAEKALKDAEKNAQAIKDQSTVIESVNKKQGQSEASWQLAQMSNVSAHKSEFARSMSMSAQVAQNIAKIDEIDSFVVTEKSATATRFTQINTRVDNAESKITSIETSLASDIKAEASKREALEAIFDLSKANQQLQLMTQATADKSLSSRLLTLSASTANATAGIDRLDEVIATNEEARAKSEQNLQAGIDASMSEISRVELVMSNEFTSQATSISNLSASLDDAKADIKTAEQAIVDNEKSQTKKNDEFSAQFDGNSANQKLSILTEATSSKSLSQRYSSISAQTANSSAEIARLDETITTNESATASSISSLKSEVDGNKASIQTISKTQTDDKQAQALVNQNVKVEFDKNKVNQQLSSLSQVTGDKSLTLITSSLSAEAGDNKANITQISQAQANLDGKVSALYTLKVEANGVVGGIMLGANEEESMVKFAVDTLAVSTPDQTTTMFSLQQVNGKTVAALNGDLIARGSISGDKITANTSIQAPLIKGGTVEGASLKGGNLNINNGACTIASNGDFYARNGRFEGTVYANKIEGDVVKAMSFSPFTGGADGFRSFNYTVGKAEYDRVISLTIPEFTSLRTAGTGSIKYFIIISGVLVYETAYLGGGDPVEIGTIIARIPAFDDGVITFSGTDGSRYRHMGGITATLYKGTPGQHKWNMLI